MNGTEKAVAVPGKGSSLGDIFAPLLANRYALYGVSIAGFLAFWQFVAVTKIIGAFMPTPWQCIAWIGYQWTDPLAGKTLFWHVWDSLHRVFIGFVIAAVLAIPLGIAMAANRYVSAVVKPIFDLLKPMPPISWISIAILWFGIGEESKVFIIAIGTFVPCLINTYNGVRLVDPALYEVVRMLGGGRLQEVLQVTFPASFPSIFAGLQISLSSAWTCVIAAELVGARSGIGFIIIQGMNLSRPAMIIGGMVVIAVVAWVLSVFVTWLEQYVCPYKREIPQ